MLLSSKKLKIIFLATAFLVSLTFVNAQEYSDPLSGLCESHFSDVADSLLECSHIELLRSKNIVSGYSDGLYHPDYNLTRGQLAKIIVDSFGLTEAQNVADFPDVGSTNKFYKYFRILRSRGIVNGYSDGLYRPDDPVTRSQFMRFVVGAGRIVNSGYYTYTYSDTRYPDVQLDNKFYEFINLLELKGLGLNTWTSSLFEPEKSITRKEAAFVLAKNMVYIECIDNGGNWGGDMFNAIYRCGEALWKWF